MKGYHIFVISVNDNDKIQKDIIYNFTEKQIIKISNSYNAQEPILLMRKPINPLKIKDINIFCSKNFLNHEKRLPNKVKLIDCTDYDYVLDLFLRGRFENSIKMVTADFLNPNTNNIQKTNHCPNNTPTKQLVFIVHGRDEASAILLQKHLTDKGINSEMFEDFKRRVKGNTTVIEELMKIKDEISYAFIIATADDIGNLAVEVDNYIDELVRGKPSVKAKDICAIKDRLKPRPRQNVMFEYGLFLGVLGRGKVECIWNVKIGDEPSDISGVLNIQFDKSIRETFTEIDARIDKIRQC